MSGHTTCIIAHRISAVKHCDEIIVLDNGRIAERGNHQQLMELNGIYAEMYQKQLLDEEIKSLD
jgi:ATP-binding cassette subfamily B protein